MFLAIFALCCVGLGIAFLLMFSIPLCSDPQPVGSHCISIIIPARNEEGNLPRLLKSIQTNQPLAPEIIVVDDGSTDATGELARTAGATVLAASSLPLGWTGKTWACAQGAEQAHGDLLLFLDADTWFPPGGLDCLLQTWEKHSRQPVVLSLLPFHVMQAPYENLSLFFNLMMAVGAGGFGAFGKPRLFGQCLLISRNMYKTCGGHSAVRGRILENFSMASRIEAVGARPICQGGRGSIHVRMFPDGLAQLYEGWKKAFADGAAASDRTILVLAVFWLSVLSTIVLLLCLSTWPLRGFAVILYLAAAAQIYWFARQIGSFNLISAMLYPIPLLFFFGVFTNSLIYRVLGRPVAWRGRKV